MIKDRIIEKLKAIEQAHQVQILWAIESGSRAWGFASSDSDYDVRFIYKHPPEHYLSVWPKRDVIEYPIDDVLDLSGWDIRKALQLFAKSNPALYEWLGSPITYIEQTDCRAKLIQLQPDYFSARGMTHHYLNMAKGNYRSYLQKNRVKLKKYFYVLRPILACMWIEKYRQTPPMEFGVMVEAFLKQDQALYEKIAQLLVQKKQGTELEEGDKIAVIHDFIEDKIAYFAASVVNTEKSTPDYDGLDQVFRKYVLS